LSLREEAIRQHQEKEVSRKIKEAADKKARIDSDLEDARRYICKRFRIEKAPDFRLVHFLNRYHPDCFFEIDGIQFEYILSNDNMRVEVICEKCQHTEMVGFGIAISDEPPDLSRLGEALSYMSSNQHNCPVDQPAWIYTIKAERARQDKKWGEQNHDDHKWNTILCEEKGEVSKAILEHDGPGVLKELSHVAAVAVAWIEAIGRRATKEKT
jgi:hypothetical protein